MMTMMNQPSSSMKLFLAFWVWCGPMTVDSFSVPVPHHRPFLLRRKLTTRSKTTTTTTTRLAAAGATTAYLDSLSFSAPEFEPALPGATDAYLESICSVLLSNLEEVKNDLEQQQAMNGEPLMEGSTMSNSGSLEAMGNLDPTTFQSLPVPEISESSSTPPFFFSDDKFFFSDDTMVSYVGDMTEDLNTASTASVPSSPATDVLSSSPATDVLSASVPSSPATDVLSSSPATDVLSSSPATDVLSSSPATEPSLWDVPIMDTNGQEIDAVVDATTATTNAMVDAATATTNAVVDAASATTSAVVEKTESLMSGILAALSSKVDGITSSSTSVVQQATTNSNSVVEQVTSQKLSDILREFGAFLKEVVRIFLDLTNAFVEAITGRSLFEISSSVTSSISNVAHQSIETAVQKFQTTIEAVGNMTMSELASALMSLVIYITQVLYYISNAVVSTISGKNITDWAQSGSQTVSQAAQAAGQQVTDTVHSLGDKSPAELAQGLLFFLEGITQRVAEIVGALGEGSAATGALMSSSSDIITPSSLESMSTALSKLVENM